MGRRDGEGRQEGFRPIGPAQSQGALEEKVWGQGEGAEGVAGPGVILAKRPRSDTDERQSTVFIHIEMYKRLLYF